MKKLRTALRTALTALRVAYLALLIIDLALRLSIDRLMPLIS